MNDKKIKADSTGSVNSATHAFDSPDLQIILHNMIRAMVLAEKGKGFVSPNPLVGALIVKDGKIVAEGYHQKYGEAHAEINAINDAKDKDIDINGSEMYVTLEPCSHYGKTPPCVEAIVESGIKKVYVGIQDPNPAVAGRGIKYLEDNGVAVESGFMEEELKIQNEVFFKYITEKIPFCVMKTAMSLDGKISTYTGDSKWISNEKSRKYVHKLRHELTAIMVGVNTIIKDDPLLNTRLEDFCADSTNSSDINICSESEFDADCFTESSDTIKIIVDSKGRIPEDARILNTMWEKPVIVATTKAISQEKEMELLEKGVVVLKLNDIDGRVDLNHLMSELGKMKIDSVLIEGGGTLNYSALNAGIVDKVVSFIAPKIIGGKDSLTPVEGTGVEKVDDSFELKDITIEKFDEDIMVQGYIR